KARRRAGMGDCGYQRMVSAGCVDSFLALAFVIKGRHWESPPFSLFTFSFAIRNREGHMNPSVTLAFLWLRRIHRWDAAWYTVAHFVGDMQESLQRARSWVRGCPRLPYQYMVTVSGKHGNGITFVAEFLLSALLMATVLYSSNHRRLARFTPTS